MMVDSDHVGEKVTQRSLTGFLIYMNMALATWLSKKELSIGSSVFGGEFVVMETGM